MIIKWNGNFSYNFLVKFPFIKQFTYNKFHSYGPQI